MGLMSTAPANMPECPTNADWLAKRMEEDIRTRGLRVGEPYLTTAQAGRQLGISKAMAYRAMRVLAKRHVLVSYPGRGTFVGPEARAGETSLHFKSIRVLLTHDMFAANPQTANSVLTGLTNGLPGFGIQFDFVPARDVELHVTRLLDQAIAEGSVAAVVSWSCPRSVQEQIMRRGVPALVIGTDYSSTRQLPSIDADQFEIGRRAGDYLLARGCQRIAVLMREMWLPGDRLLFEGVGRALDEAGLGHEALMLRNFSVEPAVLDTEMHRLLTLRDRPAGCVCSVPFFIPPLLSAAQSLGLSIPNDMPVIASSLERSAVARLGIPSVSMRVGLDELVAMGGKMLADLIKGRRPDPLHLVLPIQLIEPPEPSSLAKSRRRKHTATEAAE
jgi:DNA-binding LacI/PurR family transcriptional regulator